MTTPPTNANPTLTFQTMVPGYDPISHEICVATQVANVQTDSSSGVVFGQLSIQATCFADSDYPDGATPLTASSGNVANATAAASLVAVANVFNYCTGFDISGAGAIVGKPVIVTITDGTFTLSYIYSAIAGVLLENTPLIIQFRKPLKASAVNTAITVSCPALGSGNTNNVANIYGYQLNR